MKFVAKIVKGEMCNNKSSVLKIHGKTTTVLRKCRGWRDEMSVCIALLQYVILLIFFIFYLFEEVHFLLYHDPCVDNEIFLLF